MYGARRLELGQTPRGAQRDLVDQADADAVVRAVHDDDLVAGLQRARRGDREVGARACPAATNLRGNSGSPMPRAELRARYARAGDLELDRRRCASARRSARR